MVTVMTTMTVIMTAAPCSATIVTVTPHSVMPMTPMTPHMVRRLRHHTWCNARDYDTTMQHNNCNCNTMWCDTPIMTMTQHGTTIPTMAIQQMQLQHNAHHGHTIIVPAIPCV